MLPPDEWLQDAQRLSVGQHDRVYHGAEHRRNMVVWNKPDCWSCYCHACNEGGIVYKEHASLVQVPEPPVVLLKPPTVLESPEIPQVYKHLQEKGVSLTILRKYKPQFSPIDKRLVLTDGSAVLGRDLTGRAPAKWCNYNMQRVFKTCSHHGKLLVLTEDVYSAAKIQYYYPEVSSMALMGTRLHRECIQLLTATTGVCAWFDADTAGRSATQAVRLACRAIGVPFVTTSGIRAVDPKLHVAHEIQEVLQNVQLEFKRKQHGNSP